MRSECQCWQYEADSGRRTVGTKEDQNPRIEYASTTYRLIKYRSLILGGVFLLQINVISLSMVMACSYMARANIWLAEAVEGPGENANLA